jgi:hypothetical protein
MEVEITKEGTSEDYWDMRAGMQESFYGDESNISGSSHSLWSVRS